MSFFKNINININEIPAGSKVNVGDVGKMTYIHKDAINYKTTTTSIYTKPDEINAMCTELNAFPRFEEKGIYIQRLQKNEESLPFYNYYTTLNPEEDIFIPYGQIEYKITFDRREEKYERFYKVEKVLNHPDVSHLKRPSAMIRHACRDCAFYGRCKDAPSCFTRYIREISSMDRMTLKDAVYFKYDEKKDKLIDSVMTPGESNRTIYINRSEWSKSLSAGQNDKH